MIAKTLRLVSLLVVLGLALVMAAPRAHAAPATFTVNLTSDESDANAGDGICETANVGECTLRAAIEEANQTADTDTINFAIAGSGVHRISITNGGLPTVDYPAIIDGYSQPGSSVNTAVSPLPINSVITIELDGANTDAIGLNFINSASASELKGIAIFGFARHQLQINVSNVRVQGNYINTDATGMTTMYIENDAVGTEAVSGYGAGALLFGGDQPEDRNIVASDTTFSPGSQIGGAGTRVYGNYFGIGRDGVTDLDTYFSLDSVADNSYIGGAAEGQANVLSGSSSVQLSLTGGSDTVVQGNYIGTDYTGQINAGISNGGGIVLTYQAHDILVGGDGVGEGNTVRAVGGLGISILSMEIQLYQATLTPTNISILGNAISDMSIFNYPNFGNSNLAIDLAGSVYYNAPNQNGPDAFVSQGPTANDVGDVDTGPNNLMNTPVLKSAQQLGNQLTITYDLDVTDSPSDTYRVEFFANDESTVFGTGPAQEFIGADVAAQNGTNNTVTLTVSGDYADKALSATATAIDNTVFSGYGSTSELARNISVGSAVDFDADNISDAIEDAGPNNGDGNNDGISDRLQPTVSTFLDFDESTYITLVTEGCSENGTVSSIGASSLSAQDDGYNYPHGLADFALNCSRGETVDVTMYTFTDAALNEYSLRKYQPSQGGFIELPNATLTQETIGSEVAVRATYSLTDGGEYDDDGEANGIIVDPVGLATTSSSTNGGASPNGTAGTGSTLASTGENLRLYLFGIATLLIAGFGIAQTRRKL